MATKPLVWPVAVTAKLPGTAVFGTLNADVNVPVDVVVAVATWVPLKSTATVSLAPNPVPVTVTFEVGGPEPGFRAMLAVTAAAGDAKMPTARTMPAAAAISTRDPLRQRENPVARTLTEPVACWGMRTGPPPPPRRPAAPAAP